MDNYELIERNIDSNGFMTSATAAGYINPTYWNKRLLEHVSANLVAAQFAVDYSDLLGDGSSLIVNIEVEPAQSAATTQSTDLTITAYEATTTVAFTPTEHGKANQLHDMEARRAFFSVMERMMMNMGYAMAKELDSSIISALNTGASNSIVASSVDSSALASSNTLAATDVLAAARAIKLQKYPEMVALLVSPYGEEQLLKSPQFANAYQAGDNLAIRKGLVGKVYGIPVYVSTQISDVTASSTGHTTVLSNKAFLLGSRTGTPENFGITWKLRPEIRTQRWELGRYTNIVGINEWNIQVLRPYSFAKIEHYASTI